MLFRSTANTRANLKLTPKQTPPKRTPRPQHKALIRDGAGGSNITTTAEGGVIMDSGMFLCDSSVVSSSRVNSTEALYGSVYAQDCRRDSLELDAHLPSSSVGDMLQNDKTKFRFSSTATNITLDTTSISSGSTKSVFFSANSHLETTTEPVKKSPPKKKHKSKAKKKVLKRRNMATQTSRKTSVVLANSKFSPPTAAIMARSMRLPVSSSANNMLFGRNLHKMLVPPGSLDEGLTRPKTLKLYPTGRRDGGTPFPRETGLQSSPNPHFENFMGSYSASVTETIKHFLEEIDHVTPYLGSTTTCLKDLPEIEVVQVPEYPRVTPKDKHFDEIVNINVGGEDYFVKYGLLRQYPDTLLGSDELFDYYVEDLHCFFFDRNRFLFEYILQYYQTGMLNIPLDHIDTMSKTDKSILSDCSHKFYKIEDLLRIELEFFKIKFMENENNVEEEEEIIEDCIEAQRQEAKEMLKGLDPELSLWISRKLNLYLFLTNPQSSNWAATWMVMDYVFVLFSVVVLFLESEERFVHSLSNKHSIYARIIAVLQGTTQAFFSIDFCLRLVAWPSKNTMRGVKTFLTNGNNICDLISLMPFYLPQLISLLDNRDVKSLVVLRIIRTLRITRIFRIVRHSSRLQFIFEFLLCNNVSDIINLSELFIIMVIVFSSLIYYVENIFGHPDIFSIPSAMWWAVVTLTGIGYGDVVPLSTPGKLVAAVTIMCGMIFLALPLAIILHEFAKYMKSKGVFMWAGMNQGSRNEQAQQRFLASNSNTYRTDAIASEK